MDCKRVAIILSLGFGLLVIGQPPSVAATKKGAGKSDDAAAKTVEKVLRAEAAGQVDRRALLADALQAKSDSPKARWQAGFVRVGKSWRSFDEISSTSANSDIRRQYLAQRGRRTDV